MPFNSKLLPNKTRFNWRMVRRNKRAVSMCTRMMFFSTAALAFSGIALAEPTGGVVTGGDGVISQDGSATNINQASHQLNIDWETFNVGSAESVNFYQPSASAIAINRVINGPSEIRGAINANGRLVFLNKSGITFFEGARVNVGSLLASTAASMTMSNGVMNFSGGDYAQIINRGDITVSDGGFAILAAPHVENSGVITANLGQIHLASADSYTLDLRGDGLITFSVDAAAAANIAADGKKLGIDNSGTLRAGQIVLTAATVSQVVNSVVNLGGVVDADAFTASANGGSVLVASSGDVNLTGSISADGGANGDGGTVITWADDTNSFAAGATISARGGDVSGDGGFVEVSGTDVKFRGMVNAGATNGAAGTLLLDPINIVIADGAGAGSDVNGNETIFEETIETMSGANGTNVDLVATDTIVIQDIDDDAITGGAGRISLTTTGVPSPEIDTDTESAVAGLGRGNIIMEGAGDTISTTSGDVLISATGWQANVKLENVTTTMGGNIMVEATDEGDYVADGYEATSGVVLADVDLQGFSADGGSDISAVNLTTNNLGDTSRSAGSIDLDSNQGSVTLTGATTISSVIPGQDGSDSSVRLDIEAADDVAITGDTNITADVTDAFGNVSAIAVADIEAGMDGSGSISVGTIAAPNDFKVTATAMNMPGSEGSDNAYAEGSITMLAAGDVTIVAPVATLSVTTSATNIGTANGDATATSDLDITANEGNIDITGATVVTATALLEPGTVNNDLTVTGFGDAFSARVLGNADADADARLLATGADGAGSVIADDITVTADAIITVGTVSASNISIGSEALNAFAGGIAGNADADAHLDIDAGEDVDVTGKVSTTANAKINVAGITMTNIDVTVASGQSATFQGIGGSDIVGNTKASATVDVDATRDVVNLGNAEDGVIVGATAEQTVGAITIEADVISTGGTASFEGSDQQFASESQATAYLDINGDFLQDRRGDVNLAGGAAVTSVAKQTVESVDISGVVTATAGETSSATANFQGFDDAIIEGESMYSDAGIRILANGYGGQGGNITSGGDLTADADGILTVGPVVISADVDAVGTSGGYSASADFDGIQEAIVDADYVAVNDEGINGIALNAYGGDVNVTGDTRATGDALATVGTVSITGTVDADQNGDGSATASYTGIENGSGIISEDTDSQATVYVNAYDRDGYGGAISVTGDVEAVAESTATVGKVTISVDVTATDPSGSATANFTGMDDSVIDVSNDYDGYAYFQSSADIRLRGDSVNVDGDVLAQAAANLIVGDLDIDGTVIAEETDGYGGSVNASFTGVDDDVVRVESDQYGGYVAAAANVEIDTDGYGGITLGTTVDDSVMADADAGISVGNIEIDGSATATDQARNYTDVNAYFTGVGGNVVRSHLDQDGDDHTIFAGADLHIDATGNSGSRSVDIAGDVTAMANADVEVLDITIGGLGGDSGSATANVNASGDVDAGFTGIGDDVIDVNNESDGTNYDHDNHVLHYNHDENDHQVDYDGFNAIAASAHVEIDGNGVSIGGNGKAEATASASVMNIDINGMAEMNSTDPDGYGGHGTSDANFTGVGDDVVDIDGYGGGATAYAFLDIDARSNELNIGRNVDAIGSATASVGNISIDGSATATNAAQYRTNAGFTGIDEDVIDIYTVGGTGLSGEAYMDLTAGNVAVGGSAATDADARADAGNIDITGSASATVLEQNGYGNADATYVGIGEDVVDVEADYYGDDALYAATHLYIDADDLFDGMVQIGGNVTSQADAAIQVGSIAIGTANSPLSASATNNDDDRHSYANAYATAIGDEIVDVESYDENGVEAQAFLNINAYGGGIDIGGEVFGGVFDVSGLDGDVTAMANASVSVGTIDINGSAVSTLNVPVDFDGYGGGSANSGFTGIDGAVVDLDADYSEINAFSVVTMFAEGFNASIKIDGEVKSLANATVDVGNMTASLSASAPENDGYGGSAYASVTGVDGDDYDGFRAGEVNANALNFIFAEGLVTLTGGVETTANATVTVGTATGPVTGDNSRFTEAVGYAGTYTNIASTDNDVTSGGDISSTANAIIDVGQNTEDSVLDGAVFSEGFLAIMAGYSDGSGSVGIVGDVTVGAKSELSDGTNTETYDGEAGSFAAGLIAAANHVVIDGQNIGATAISDTTGHDAYAFSGMIVKAGDRALINEESDLVEDTLSEGNVDITGDVFARATATSIGGESSHEEAGALLELSAHGEGPDGGSVINEYLTLGQQPQAVATETHNTEGNGTGVAFTNATQDEVNNARDVIDMDGSPTTFIEISDIGGPSSDESLVENEIELPSDYASLFGFYFEEFDISAATIVHFHEEALIFGPETPLVLEGIDPFILIHSGPTTTPSTLLFREVAGLTPDDATEPGQSPTTLSLTPGSTACSMGEDGIAINSDGQLLFAEFMFQETELEFGENGCDEVVSFPQVDVQ